MQSTSRIDVIPIKTLSTLQAFMLIFKSRFAMGLVFLPYQYGCVGLVPATILSICIAFYTFYSLHNQVMVKHELGDKLGYKFMSYSYVMETVAAPKLLIRFIWISHEILQTLQNVMLCCCYTFVIAVIASLIVKGTNSYYQLVVIILILPAMIFYQIPTYHTLSYYVAVAILLSVFSCIIILFDLISKGVKSSPKELEALLFNEYEKIPIFVGTFVFTISPVSVLDAIETFMQNPKRLQGWHGILWLTIGIDLITLILIGIFGSIAFRNKIFFNMLEHYLHGEVSDRFLMIFLFISMFITTAIHFNVAFGIIWLHFFEGIFSINQELESEASIRAILILVIYILSICWNHLNTIVPIAGAFCAIPLTFVYPHVLELMVIWPERFNYSKWRIIKIIVCNTFGFGLYITIMYFTILYCYGVFTQKI